MSSASRKQSRCKKRPRPLTEAEVEDARAGPRDYWLTDAQRSRGTGRLALRVTRGGSKRFYFRYTQRDGTRVHVPIGTYSKTEQSDAFTFGQARDKATDYSKLLRGEAAGDLKEFLDRATRAATAQSIDAALTAEASAANTAAAAPLDESLRALLEAYVADRKDNKKPSARDAANIFKNHVYNAWPALAAAPAASITTQHVVAMLRAVTGAKHGRTAAKLRGYLRAAYAQALGSHTDASVPATIARFGLTTNPAAATKPLNQYNLKRTRTLDSRELGFFWGRLLARDDAAAQTLVIAVLLGGQRLAQLLRLRCTEVNLVDGTLLLHDPKGRRPEPRLHWLPITPAVRARLAPVVERSRAAGCDWVFSAALRRPTCVETLSEVVTEICAAMLEAEETGAKFEMRDLRRTAETRLGGLDVSRDTRAQIQSHGLFGVQENNYDQNKYLAQKREALELWARHLAKWEQEAAASCQPCAPTADGTTVTDLAAYRTRRQVGP